MNRRKFVKNTALTRLTIGTVPSFASSLETQISEPFHLKFAPHLGMFKYHAGDDPLAQLDFMSDQGFNAFEDNEMRNRSIDLQQKMADRMSKHEIEMGVLVANEIYWQESNLTNGKEKYRVEFLNDIKKSLEEYNGIIGMEHSNSQNGLDGELKVINAYRQVDPK